MKDKNLVKYYITRQQNKGIFAPFALALQRGGIGTPPLSPCSSVLDCTSCNEILFRIQLTTSGMHYILILSFNVYTKLIYSS